MRRLLLWFITGCRQLQCAEPLHCSCPGLSMPVQWEQARCALGQTPCTCRCFGWRLCKQCQEGDNGHCMW